MTLTQITRTFLLNGILLMGLASCDRSGPVVESSPLDPALERHDGDEDGTLSETERETMNAEFVKQFDKDGDLQLDPGERNSIRNKNVKVRIAGKSKAPATLEEAATFLSGMDQNKDGTVSEEEAGEKRWKVMARADKDGNGQVSSAEWMNRNTRASLPQ